MRAREVLRRMNALPLCSVADLAGAGGLLVLAPHPDDETLGCGALIAAARAEGRGVTIVVVSDGTGSHPRSADWAPSSLRRLRHDEACQAAEALGVEPGALHFLDLPDRRVPEGDAVFETACRTIAGLADATKATALFATWRQDPHCDHQATWSMGVEVARRKPAMRLWAYPVWGWTLPPDEDAGPPPDGCRFPAAAFLDRKARALGAYRSQMGAVVTDDPSGFTLPPDLLALAARPFEAYLRP